MRILKKIVKKLYHLIWFLSLYLLFLIPVNADAVPISNQYVSGQMCTSSGTCEWVTNTNFYNGVLVSTSSNSRRPRTFGWNLNINANTSTTYTAKFTLAFYYDYAFNQSGYWYFRDYIQSSNVTFGELNGRAKDISCSTGALNRSSSPRSDKIAVTCIFNVKSGGSAYYFLGATNANYNDFGLVPYGSGTSFTVESYSIEGSTDSSGIIINQNQTIINQNQQQIQEQRETNEKLDDIDDTLNDQTINSPDNGLNNMKQQLPTNSVISDLLLMPIRLLQSIVNSLGGTCSSFNLGSLYGTNLIMPCIDIESYLGSAIWTFIDLVFSGMFVLVIRKKFIQIWENITNLRSGGNEVD